MTTVCFVGRGRGFRGFGGGWRRPMMGRRRAFMGFGCLLLILCLCAAVVAFMLWSGGRRGGPVGSPAPGGFDQRQAFATSRGAVPLPEFQARPAGEWLSEARYESPVFWGWGSPRRCIREDGYAGGRTGMIARRTVGADEAATGDRPAHH